MEDVAGCGGIDCAGWKRGQMAIPTVAIIHGQTVLAEGDDDDGRGKPFAERGYAEAPAGVAAEAGHSGHLEGEAFGRGEVLDFAGEVGGAFPQRTCVEDGNGTRKGLESSKGGCELVAIEQKHLWRKRLQEGYVEIEACGEFPVYDGAAGIPLIDEDEREGSRMAGTKFEQGDVGSHGEELIADPLAIDIIAHQTGESTAESPEGKQPGGVGCGAPAGLQGAVRLGLGVFFRKVLDKRTQIESGMADAEDFSLHGKWGPE